MVELTPANNAMLLTLLPRLLGQPLHTQWVTCSIGLRRQPNVLYAIDITHAHMVMLTSWRTGEQQLEPTLS